MKISEKTAFNLFLKNQSAQPGRDLNLSPETRRNIFYLVLAGHILFFIFPFVLDYIQKIFTPKRLHAITVKLIEDQQRNSIVKNEPQKPLPEPPKPTEDPKPEPQKPIENPKPAPQKKVEEPPKKIKVEPKTVEKKPVEKTKEKLKPIEKPKWTPIDPKEIQRSTQIVKKQDTPAPKIDTKNLKEKLNQISNSVKTKSTSTSSTSNIEPNDYYDKVSAYLYQIWQQPSKTELKGAKPIVIVLISLDHTGRVISSSIKIKSMNQAMDNSVEQLLNQLSSLPAPPSGAISFEVSLEISD